MNFYSAPGDAQNWKWKNDKCVWYALDGTIGSALKDIREHWQKAFVSSSLQIILTFEDLWKVIPADVKANKNNTK